MLSSNKELGVEHRTKEDRIGCNKAWSFNEVQKFIEYAEKNKEIRYADMVRIAYLHGLRIHEVIRLDKNQLVNALKEGILIVKGKGGLVRKYHLIIRN